MILEQIHTWDLTPSEAVQLQKELRKHTVLEDSFGEVKLVAGLDVGLYSDGTSTAAAVVMSYPELEILEKKLATRAVTFPYIPGLLAFREVPVLVDALEMLELEPDILLVDGQGYAHPRRFGIACHIGVLTGKPTIGVGKSRLTGHFEEPGLTAGDRSNLLADKDEKIGVVVRTKNNVKPLFISPGNKVSFDTAVDMVLSCIRGRRLPEPIRIADSLVKRTV